MFLGQYIHLNRSSSKIFSRFLERAVFFQRSDTRSFGGRISWATQSRHPVLMVHLLPPSPVLRVNIFIPSLCVAICVAIKKIKRSSAFAPRPRGAHSTGVLSDDSLSLSTDGIDTAAKGQRCEVLVRQGHE